MYVIYWKFSIFSSSSNFEPFLASRDAHAARWRRASSPGLAAIAGVRASPRATASLSYASVVGGTEFASSQPDC
jgi:hypothetical protein